MKSLLLAVVALLGTVAACTVHDRKPPSEDPKTETSEPSAAEAEGEKKPTPEPEPIPIPQPSVTLSLDNLQVYRNESVTLTWSSQNAEACVLKANGEAQPKVIATSGSENFNPSIDTNYEIACESAAGLNASGGASVKILGDDDILLAFPDAGKASQYIDLSLLADENCGSVGCLFADLEPSYFSKDTANTLAATDEFLGKLTRTETLVPENRAVNVKSIAAEFDLASSVVYGAEDRISELGLSAKCQANFTVPKDAVLQKSYALSTKIEDSFESLPDTKLKAANVIVGLQISGKGRRGTITAGTDLTATYRAVDIIGSPKVSFTDFEAMKGQFKLSKSAISSNDVLRKLWAKIKNILTEASAYAVSFPAGYPVPPPARGYQYDPLHATCNSDAPTIRVSTSYANKTVYCQATGALCCETGKGCPTQWPFTVVKTSTGLPMSSYVARVRSLRVVAGQGTVQCGALFPGLVSYYNISSSWVANSPNAQFFVTDSSWPTCGGYSCADKILRTSSAEIPTNVEPAYNHCIERWVGLDFNSYLSILQTDCQNTDVFRAAVAAKAARDADQSYANACKADQVCKDAILSTAAIRNEFPLATLRKKVETEEAALTAAKTTAVTYLVKDPLFLKASVQKLAAHITKLSTGLDRAEALRRSTTPNADWNGGATIIHQQGIITGFANFNESKASVADYAALQERIAALTIPKATDVGCNFFASGRFRQYSAAGLEKVTLIPSGQPGYNVQLKLLQDYIAK